MAPELVHKVVGVTHSINEEKGAACIHDGQLVAQELVHNGEVHYGDGAWARSQSCRYDQLHQ